MAFNKQTNSGLNTFIINCENKESSSQQRHKHYKRKCHHEERKTKTSCSGHAERHISQHIHVVKEEFQCIINLKTTVCDHKSRHKEKCYKDESKHSDSKYNISHEDRIVPYCFRRDCRVLRPYEIRSRIRLDMEKVRAKNVKYCHNRKHEQPFRRHEDENIHKHVHHKCSRQRVRYHEEKHNNSKILTSISSLPLKDDFEKNLTYDEISTTSLETLVDKPLSYKLAKHEEDSERYESKLDTLIKRAKERERKLVEQSRSRKLWHTSTPVYTDCSSGDFPMSNSDLDISIQSRSTLILETQQCIGYSPLIMFEDLHQNSEIEKLSYRAYSQSSPIHSEDYTMKLSENNDKLLNIKDEPTMCIEAYSPIQSPDYFSVPQNLCELNAMNVKQEIELKKEPQSSPDLNPDYFERVHQGLYYRTENIKREVIEE